MSDSRQKPEEPGDQAKEGLNQHLQDFDGVKRILAVWADQPPLRPRVDEALAALASLRGELVRLHGMKDEVEYYVKSGYREEDRLVRALLVGAQNAEMASGRNLSDSHGEPERPGDQARKGVKRDLDDFERVRRVLVSWALDLSLRTGVDDALAILARLQGELVRLRRMEYEVEYYVENGGGTPARLRASIGMRA
jgi:hypothetical protein